jgi:hypothetical protein
MKPCNSNEARGKVLILTDRKHNDAVRVILEPFESSVMLNGISVRIIGTRLCLPEGAGSP